MGLSQIIHQNGFRIAALVVAVSGLITHFWVALAALVFDPAEQPDGWVNRPVLSSYNVSSGNEVLFRAEYRVGEWSGAINANYIDSSGNIQGTSPWSTSNAAQLIDAQNFDSQRLIVTRNAAGANVPFRWASLSAAQQNLLGTATTGPVLLNYVRGDRSNEAPAGTKLRARATTLGAIQQSTLLYWKYADGTKRLYVGANDGMLHALDAATGKEVFAYIPSMLMPKLKNLAADPFGHTSFVDGALAMANVLVGSSVKTLLVGALGAGGQGLFMLDVTDPTATSENTAAAKIKWEITPASTGFSNLGYTYSAPKLARLNNGAAAVIVGNGYASTGSGRSTLLLIDADTGALIREIDTGSGSAGSPGGLSSPTLVDSNDDGKVDLVYAGDIDGKLWRFDLSASTPAGYTATLVHTTAPVRAITVAPVVTPHPNGGRMVMFGTGRMLSAGDATDTASDSVYGIWDGAPASNTTLLSQTLTETSFQTGVSTSIKLRYASANQPNWSAGGHRGWQVILPAGERVLGEAPFFNDNRFYFTSTNPTIAAATEGASTGMSWVNELNFLTGGALTASVFDINDDNQINDADKVGGQVIVAKQLGAGLYSQPALVDLVDRSLTIFNQQSGLSSSLPATELVTEPGITGGHFDVDIYHTVFSAPGGKFYPFQQSRHTHEYDDLYDVTGVNFLNASNTNFNLSNAIPSTSTKFKVLVMNQYLNPAAQMSVGGQPYVSVKSYGGLASVTDPNALMTSLPVYTRATVNTLAFKLPLNAFTSLDWWGNGDVRAGLMPTQTGCVNKFQQSGATRMGPQDERRNGALTIQIVKDTVTGADLEPNGPGNPAGYGWRLKIDKMPLILAEYTVFWHHPNGKCYGDTGWVKNPAGDTGTSKKAARAAAGSTDPKEGSFDATVPATVTVVSVISTVTGNTTVITTTYSDGKTSTITITANGNGTENVVLVDRNGSSVSLVRSIGGSAVRGAEETLQSTRRISWREIRRP